MRAILRGAEVVRITANHKNTRLFLHAFPQLVVTAPTQYTTFSILCLRRDDKLLLTVATTTEPNAGSVSATAMTVVTSASAASEGVDHPESAEEEGTDDGRRQQRVDTLAALGHQLVRQSRALASRVLLRVPQKDRDRDHPEVHVANQIPEPRDEDLVADEAPDPGQRVTQGTTDPTEESVHLGLLWPWGSIWGEFPFTEGKFCSQ